MTPQKQDDGFLLIIKEYIGDKLTPRNKTTKSSISLKILKAFYNNIYLLCIFVPHCTFVKHVNGCKWSKTAMFQTGAKIKYNVDTLKSVFWHFQWLTFKSINTNVKNNGRSF